MHAARFVVEVVEKVLLELEKQRAFDELSDTISDVFSSRRVECDSNTELLSFGTPCRLFQFLYYLFYVTCVFI